MLFKNAILKGIRAGRVSLAFRRWKRAAATKGQKLLTDAGVVEILEVAAVPEGAITVAEARKAGYGDLESLLKELDRWPTGDLYRIRVRFHGEDPRITLREDARLTEDDRSEIGVKLASLDKRSRRGPWTSAFLSAIAQNPGLPARDLAAAINWDAEDLKLKVRRLKELGLTESLQPGYRLSPRGRAWMQGHAERSSNGPCTC